MTLQKLKRELQTCGKDFFIDNYKEIKDFTYGIIDRENLLLQIAAKDKWNDISTILNRVSAIKLIFERDQIIDALKLTIESRCPEDVKTKALELFETESGRPYNILIDQITFPNQINLIGVIVNEIQKSEIQNLCSDINFRFQLGTDKLIEFDKYELLSNYEIEQLQKQFKKSSLTFSDFLNQIESNSKQYKLLTLLGEVVSYCDLHAANKNKFNLYKDKRTLGKAGVRMNDWVDKLLSYKFNGNDINKLTPSIKNAIIYLKNPADGLTMLSENHRKKVSENLFKIKNYHSSDLINNFESFFEPYNIQVSNYKNKNEIYCTILYSDNVRKLWLNEEQILTKTYRANNYIMNLPLNQIFYGPPGTGKTYNIINQAERIVNIANKTTDVSIKFKFDRIIKSIRNKYTDPIYDKLNGNNIYRNFSKSMVVWGLYLEDEFDESNTIIHDKIKDRVGFKRSGWSQRIRYLSEFGFIEGDWLENLSGNLGADLTLSNSGKKLKKNLRTYLAVEGIPESNLKSWERNQEIPSIVRNTYLDVIRNVSPDSNDMTAFKKTIICALNMCKQGFLFKQNNESRNSTEEEIELIEKFFDVNKIGNTDYKWIGWVAENLVDLGLIAINNQEKNARYYYYLTDLGESLIESIVTKWEQQIPSLFGDYINYETAIKLGQVKFITFHQSYSYEEFIEGIRPRLDDEKELTYTLNRGVFKELCRNAKNDLKNNYVIIIDEINRGNISKIFGELITLIEPTKRLFSENLNEHPKTLLLPYSKESFGVPKNVYILGTMNTADKSIALLDSALRRRFSFIEMLPDSDIVEQNIQIDSIDLKKLFETINRRIEYLLDKDHMIGHSYFLKIKENPSLESLGLLFKNEIIPLLNEYFYGDFEKIQLVLGDNKDWKSKNSIKFFTQKSSGQKSLFGKEEVIEGYDDKLVFELNKNIFDLNDDGNLKGSKSDLIQLFESIYTAKSN